MLRLLADWLLRFVCRLTADAPPPKPRTRVLHVCRGWRIVGNEGCASRLLVGPRGRMEVLVPRLPRWRRIVCPYAYHN